MLLGYFFFSTQLFAKLLLGCLIIAQEYSTQLTGFTFSSQKKKAANHER